MAVDWKPSEAPTYTDAAVNVTPILVATGAALWSEAVSTANQLLEFRFQATTTMTAMATTTEAFDSSTFISDDNVANRTSSSSTSAGDLLLLQTSSAMSTGKTWSALRQPLYAAVLLAVAYSVVVVLGLVNNILVIAVIYRQAKMRTVTNYFLANLATADVLVCITVLPITLLHSVYTGELLTPFISPT